MPALRKYDQETRHRAVRMYQDRRRDFPAESALQARRRVGELADVKAETLRGWIERVEIDTLVPCQRTCDRHSLLPSRPPQSVQLSSDDGQTVHQDDADK